MVKLSIIIPVYNHFEELVQLLDNLETQSFKDFEVIVVDDGSENTAIKLEVMLKKRSYKIFFYEINHGGASAARNFGYQKSEGEYVLFADADILFKPIDALKIFVLALDRNPSIAFVYCEYNFGFKKMKGIMFDLEKLKSKNYIHTTTMLRRDFFCGFDESLKRFQDWDLWLSICERGGQGMLIKRNLFKIKPRKFGISKWIPSFAYLWPFNKLFFSHGVAEYNKSKKIVLKKHSIKYED